MKKICIITSMIYPVPALKGGAVEGLVELLARMNEKYNCIDLTVVSIYDENSEIESRKYKNTRFIYVKKNKIDKFLSKKIFIYINKIFMKFMGKTIIDMPYVKKAMKKLEVDSFDRYILEGGGDCYNFGYLHKIIATEKLYVHFHGEVVGDKAIATWFGKYITVSNYIGRRLICNGIVDSQKVAVLPNCYDKSSMMVKNTKEQIREKYKLDPDDIVFVYWGRLLPQKGVFELLEAFKILVSNYHKAKLLIVGNANFGYSTYSTYDEKLQEICGDVQLNNRIIFTGFVPHDDMGSILSACDIGVIPSVWDDPAPLTVFEGLSKGLPLIAGNVGGIPEIIDDGNNGILVRWSPAYVNDLYVAMCKLIDSSNLRLQFSTNGKKTIENYNEDIFYKKFIEIISE